ncbi:hypothetical protein SODALDRAFT_339678 [Sodiomyces alkalinus F11]|uniref:Protein kinase domain-containing protein n=1 Tax=Sodiomyces alkalinus (strain CBS 110278 / VKM F-3762 / F11) TaxID=1314773 RepID=A0A3N2PXT3_SODAK|nr:hypothetical protein SODALDRAFT_339678 [Sodiomyces alkalinus F11]ROT39292.1 hypothetical protein SODALDRAFT_339678 [Sodiomyces alkalinus F11]
MSSLLLLGVAVMNKEQRLREEAQRRHEQELRRREEAEKTAAASQPQPLQQYLEACHSLDRTIQVITDRSLSTQGDATNPTGRIYPRRIVPWVDFAAKQEDTWNKLAISNTFSSQPAFPSPHQLDYVRSFLTPISSELGLRDFERDVVEHAVQRLMERTHQDPLLRRHLRLQGTVTFESHTNPGVDDISTSLEEMSLGQDGVNPNTSASAAAPRPSAATRGRRRVRGKGNRADQFCIYRTSDGRNVPALAIEYKAPHKLSVDELATGLESEIQPDRDVINQDGEGFVFSAKALAAAVVTQLFSYMVGKGIQYGYVCTGQAFVFLHIPNDPSIVYYSVCVPSMDVMDDDETRLHRTAVAQVFAFIVRAVQATPPPTSWHDEAAKLELWAIEYEDILKKIPESDRKGKERRATPYKPQRWKGFTRSPILTRSRCLETDASAPDESDDEGPPSPSPSPSHPVKQLPPSAGAGPKGGREKAKRGQRRGQSGAQKEESQSMCLSRTSIRDGPFCTQQCLLGLAYGEPVDRQCPNAIQHGLEHISRLAFLRLMKNQLETDRGSDADCIPLHLSGSRGTLFKLRLSSHGYTLVAKGVESLDRKCLQHESDIYDQLQAIQGKHIPVCLGIVDLDLPQYYDSGVYTHLLFLSWAGQPLFDGDQAQMPGVAEKVDMILEQMHKLGVLHRDADPRNMLWDPVSGNVMAVDFERAESCRRPVLERVAPNGQTKKRKRGKPRQSKDDFTREREWAVAQVSRYLIHLPSRADGVHTGAA